MPSAILKNQHVARKNRIEYQIESAKIDFAHQMDIAIRRAGMARSEIARRMETSPAYVTKALRGDMNLTIESMVRFASSIGSRLHINVTPNLPDVRVYVAYPGTYVSDRNDVVTSSNPVKIVRIAPPDTDTREQAA